VSGDSTRPVSQEILAIFKRNPSSSEPAAKIMLEVMHPDPGQASSFASLSPCSVAHSGQRLFVVGKDIYRVNAAHFFNDGPCNCVEDY
jgi:hypothetical protein